MCSRAIFTVRNLLWLKVKKQANKADTANNQATCDRTSFYDMFTDMYCVCAALRYVQSLFSFDFEAKPLAGGPRVTDLITPIYL